MQTNQLIELLAREAGPVRPLSAPFKRALAWLAVSLAYVALVVLIARSMTLPFRLPPVDLSVALSDAGFMIEQAAAFATAVAAAIAAFALTVPGYSRRWALLPLPLLGLWLASLGWGCVQDWLRFGAAGLTMVPDWAPWYGPPLVCLAGISVVGALPALAIVAMLRQGAPLWPPLTVALAALAAAALGAFGLRLFHSPELNLMVLVWQFGTVIALALAAGPCGRHVIYWRHIVPAHA